MGSDPAESPQRDLVEALRKRLERERDVVVAYLADADADAGPGVGAVAHVGVLVDGDVDDLAQRHACVRTAIEDAVGPGCVELVVLNHVSATEAYRVLAGGRRLLCRDHHAHDRFRVATIEQYFEVGELRRMLATSLRHRLGSGGADPR